MTVSATELLLYAGGMFLLFITPGPVWVALTARTLSGGFAAAWPLALGVALGDVVWPLLAIFGLSWMVGHYADLMTVLRWVAAAIFLIMGLLLIRGADRRIERDSRLTRPGMWAGFVAGVVVILGNPKAILFYMGVLPGFFDLSDLTGLDVAAILLMSIIVPLIGNLSVAIFVDRVRRLLTSERALWRLNVTSGALLILVGVAILFT